MAQKVTQQAPGPDDPAPENDLEILDPNRTITIAGETITVREYGFIEGLKLRAVAAPLVDALYRVLQSDTEIEFEMVLDILADNLDAFKYMASISIDRPLEWIEALDHKDGDYLLDIWWAVNAGFFVSRAIRRVRLEAEMASLRAQRSDGATSSPSSSNTDTQRTAPSDTPSDS